MGDEITEAELAIAAAQVKQLAAEAGRQATEAARWRATAEVLSIKNKNLREALERILLKDRRVAGRSSEDHHEYDGPCGRIAAEALFSN
jgi:hypothetical protein